MWNSTGVLHLVRNFTKFCVTALCEQWVWLLCVAALCDCFCWLLGLTALCTALVRAFIRLAYQDIRLTHEIRFISKRRNIISELLLTDPRSINASASKIGQRLLSTSMFRGCSSILISRTRVRSRGSQLSKLHLQFYPSRKHDLRSFGELSAEIAKIPR